MGQNQLTKKFMEKFRLDAVPKDQTTNRNIGRNFIATTGRADTSQNSIEIQKDVPDMIVIPSKPRVPFYP
jgi:hypothetical protein